MFCVLVRRIKQLDFAVAVSLASYDCKLMGKRYLLETKAHEHQLFWISATSGSDSVTDLIQYSLIIQVIFRGLQLRSDFNIPVT